MIDLQKNIYLFYGDEGYFLKEWENQILSRLPAELKALNLEYVTDGHSLMQSPFMADCRISVFKNLNLFDTKARAKATALLDDLKAMPDTSIALIIEKAADKRTALFKHIAKEGLALEAAMLKEQPLARWIVSFCKARGKTMPMPLAIYAARLLPPSMLAIEQELLKLVDYCNNKNIEQADIDNICTKSIEAKIFDLMKAMSRRDKRLCQELYRGLIAQKESPLMVLSMIARQLRFTLLCGSLSLQMSQGEIAKKLSLHPYAVSEFIAMAREFTENQLTRAMQAALDTDYKIKTGQIRDEVAVELLLLNI